jgi:hypothetical protein
MIVFFIASLVFGSWKRLRHGKGIGWPLMGITVIDYFVGIYLVYYGSPRYHFPIIPWVIMYSAALLSSIYIYRLRGLPPKSPFTIESGDFIFSINRASDEQIRACGRIDYHISELVFQ